MKTNLIFYSALGILIVFGVRVNNENKILKRKVSKGLFRNSRGLVKDYRSTLQFELEPMMNNEYGIE